MYMFQFFEYGYLCTVKYSHVYNRMSENNYWKYPKHIITEKKRVIYVTFSGTTVKLPL